MAQLLRTMLTYSKAPNPHPRTTSTQNFHTSYWHTTPNTIYIQQAANPACQEDTNAKFSHLLMAQLPRTQFTYNSKLPNPHGSDTLTQNFRSADTSSANADITAAAQICHTDTASANAKIFTTTKMHHTDTSSAEGPAATSRAADPSSGSGHCTCRAEPGAHRRHRAPQTLPAALDTTPATHSRRGPAATPRTADPSSGSGYSPATQNHRGPAATPRAADPSSGSGYCACHTELPGPSGDTARRRPF